MLVRDISRSITNNFFGSHDSFWNVLKLLFHGFENQSLKKLSGQVADYVALFKTFHDMVELLRRL